MTNINFSNINKLSVSYEQQKERTSQGNLSGHSISSKQSKSLFQRIIDKIKNLFKRIVNIKKEHKSAPTAISADTHNYSLINRKDNHEESGLNMPISNLEIYPQKIENKSANNNLASHSKLDDCNSFEMTTLPVPSSESSTSHKTSDQPDEVTKKQIVPRERLVSIPNAIFKMVNRSGEIILFDPPKTHTRSSLTSERTKAIENEIERLNSEMSNIKKEMENTIARWRENPEGDSYFLTEELNTMGHKFARMKEEARELREELAQSRENAPYKSWAGKSTIGYGKRISGIYFFYRINKENIRNHFIVSDKVRRRSGFLADELIEFLTGADPKNTIEILKEKFIERIKAKQKSGIEHIVVTYLKKQYTRTVREEVSSFLNACMDVSRTTPTYLDKPIEPGMSPREYLDIIETDTPLQDRIFSENEEKREEIVYIRPFREKEFDKVLEAIEDFFKNEKFQKTINDFLNPESQI